MKDPYLVLLDSRSPSMTTPGDLRISTLRIIDLKSRLRWLAAYATVSKTAQILREVPSGEYEAESCFAICRRNGI